MNIFGLFQKKHKHKHIIIPIEQYKPVKTFTTQVNCPNCRNFISLNFPVGTNVRLAHKTCSICEYNWE